VTSAAPEVSSRWRAFWEKAGWVLFLFVISRLLIVALVYY
jgi:hypothetical protein